MIIPLVTVPYVSRVIGADGVGQYSYTYSIAQYFLLFGMLGIEHYGNRSIAKVRDNEALRNKTFSEIYSLQLIIASTSIAIYIPFVLLWNKVDNVLGMLQVFYVLAAAFDINWLFFGMEDFKLTVTRKIVIKIVNLVGIFVFIRERGDVWKYVLLLSLGYFVAQSSMWLFVNRYVRFKFCVSQNAGRHLKEALILFVPTIAISVYRMMDKVMLGSMSSMLETGYYESAEKIITICTTFISAFGAVMMPRMSNLLGQGEVAKMKQLFVRAMEIAMFIGCAVCFGIISISADFVPIFFGDGYEPSVLVSQMLASTVVFITWSCIIRTLYLIPAEKNRIYITSVSVSAVINIVVNYLMIPRYGAAGAAVGTMTAEIMVALTQTVMIRGEMDIIQCVFRSAFFLLDGAVMMLIVMMLPIKVEGNILLLLTKVAIGAAVYVLLAIAYFVKTKNQLFYDLTGPVIKKIKRIIQKNG